jgi:hypothetical protein
LGFEGSLGRKQKIEGRKKISDLQYDWNFEFLTVGLFLVAMTAFKHPSESCQRVFLALPAAISRTAAASTPIPKSGAPPSSGGWGRSRGRGGLLFRGDFFAFEVGDAALAFFAFVVLFAHIFFTLL